MGICNVLAIIPFLCAASAEEPRAEEEEDGQPAIEAQPAPEVAVGVLAPPPPTNRRVMDLQVLPPAGGPVAELPPQPAARPAVDPDSFGEWVNQNWGDEADGTAMADGFVPEPRIELGVIEVPVEMMAEPALELYVEPAPEFYVEPEFFPASGELVRLEPPAEPAPELYVEPDFFPTSSDVVRLEPPAEPIVTAPEAPTPIGPEAPTPIGPEAPTPIGPEAPTPMAASGPVAIPEPVAMPDPVAIPEPMGESQVAMSYTARFHPGLEPAKVEEITIAATASSSWDVAAALADGSLGFAQPVVLARRGQQVAADGIAARKRLQMRRIARELRRQTRDRGE